MKRIKDPRLRKATNRIARAIRDFDLTYEEVLQVSAAARKRQGLVKKQREKSLPHLPSIDHLSKFFATIRREGNPQDNLMAKLLLYSGIRNSELVHLRVEDVDLAGGKLFVRQGKGGKQRYVTIYHGLKDALFMHMQVPIGYGQRKYLFEPRPGKMYTTRAIRKKIAKYCVKAEIPHMHPHLFRHIFCTHLTAKGWDDAQIQLLSGHSDKNSLGVYQHLALTDVEDQFQVDMAGIGV